MRLMCSRKHIPRPKISGVGEYLTNEVLSIPARISHAVVSEINLTRANEHHVGGRGPMSAAPGPSIRHDLK